LTAQPAKKNQESSHGVEILVIFSRHNYLHIPQMLKTSQELKKTLKSWKKSPNSLYMICYKAYQLAKKSIHTWKIAVCERRTAMWANTVL